MTQALPERFQTLFRQHYGSVLRKLRYLVGDAAIAEDLAQEVFLRLYRQPPSDISAVGAWLHRVSTRVAYDYSRKRSRLHRLEAREKESGLSVTTETSSEWLVLQQAERDVVKRVLKQLSDRDRQVLLLRYSDYSYREMADILGVKQALIGTILSRALQRFKRKYQEEEGTANEA